MKRLAILGGMGSQASAYFVNELICQTPAKKDQDHIPFVLLNACNVPDRTTAIKAENTTSVFDAIRPYLDECIQLGVFFTVIDDTIQVQGKLEPKGTTIDVKVPLGGVIKRI